MPRATQCQSPCCGRLNSRVAARALKLHPGADATTGASGEAASEPDRLKAAEDVQMTRHEGMRRYLERFVLEVSSRFAWVPVPEPSRSCGARPGGRSRLWITFPNWRDHQRSRFAAEWIAEAK